MHEEDAAEDTDREHIIALPLLARGGLEKTIASQKLTPAGDECGTV
jgi:hypothetical protein